jgi:hypothetical protein
MKLIDINTTLIDGYLKLLGNLSTDIKLDLISKLTLSIKADLIDKKKSFYKASGAWESKKSAEEIRARPTSSDFKKFIWMSFLTFIIIPI